MMGLSKTGDGVLYWDHLKVIADHVNHAFFGLAGCICSHVVA